MRRQHGSAGLPAPQCNASRGRSWLIRQPADFTGTPCNADMTSTWAPAAAAAPPNAKQEGPASPTESERGAASDEEGLIDSLREEVQVGRKCRWGEAAHGQQVPGLRARRLPAGRRLPNASMLPGPAPPSAFSVPGVPRVGYAPSFNGSDQGR